MASAAQKMTVGVGFSEGFIGKNKAAFDYFMENAESCTVLSTSSKCSLILCVTLPHDLETPYISFNPTSDEFIQPARQILLKIIPTHNIPGKDDYVMSTWERILGDDKKISSIREIEYEYDIQKTLYRKSITDPNLPLYPICPSVLYLETMLSDARRENLLKNIKDILISKNQNDAKIINTYFNLKFAKNAGQPDDATAGVSIFAMELLEGYATLTDKIDGHYGDREYLKQMKRYAVSQIVRLHKLGYYNNDLHAMNIMYNDDTCQALLIDFSDVLSSDDPKFPGVCTEDINSINCILSTSVFKDDYDGTTPAEIADMNIDELFAEARKKCLGYKEKLCVALGADCAADLATIIATKLVESGHVLRGGGNKKSISQRRDNKLLLKVIYNALRQNDTPAEFNKYLLQHVKAQRKTSTKKSKTIKRKSRKSKFNAARNTERNTGRNTGKKAITLKHKHAKSQVPPSMVFKTILNSTS